MSEGERSGVGQTRREAIKRGLALVGVAGAAASGRIALDAAPAGASERPSGDSGHATGGHGLAFSGQGFDASGAALVRGTLPDRGESLIISGELLDGTGTVVGEVFGTYLQLLPFGQAGVGDVTSLQEHTFNLAGGTIHGRGVATADLDAVDLFAIVGGTGRYAGLQGSYTAIQRFLSIGGDGTAQFVLTTNPERSDHGGS